MRFAIDLTAVRSRGTQVYCLCFLPALARQLAHGDECLLFLSPTAARMVLVDPGPAFRRVGIGLAERPYLRVAWQQVRLPVHLRSARVDALYSPWDMAPLRSSCPVLLGIHNPAPHLPPVAGYSWRVRLDNALRRYLARASCRRARRVLFPSRFAADFLGASLGVPEEKRAVVYHGTDHARWAWRDDSMPLRRRLGIGSSPYILFVSQLYREKEPEVLIKGVSEWMSASGRNDYRLLFAGEPPDRRYGAELRALAVALGMSDRTLFLGLVPHADVASLYHGASVFVLPTRSETFGQPLVEAMASGVPVICADTPLAREICGEAARYFAIGDTAALAQAIATVIGDSNSLRQEMIKRGLARSKRYSWDREARETLGLIYEISRSRRTPETSG